MVPGSTAPPLLQTLRWLFRPLAFLDGNRRRFGDTFAVRFLGFKTPMVMTSDPEAIRELYRGRENGLPPGRELTLRPILGADSVLLLEGSDHIARRKVMLPPFHGERMRAYEGVIAEAARRDVDSWPVGEPFAVHPHMQAVTLAVILKAVFGVTDPERSERLRSLLAGLLSQASSPGLQFMFLVVRRLGIGPDPLARLQETLKQVHAVLDEEIAERRADPEVEAREDILSMLVAARFADGSAMSDAELRDQLMTLLLAGHETTATALAWTIDLLVRHPAALARLRAEVLSGEGDEYLRAVISESLRLRPVVPLAGRRLRSPMTVGAHTLPGGTDITPAIWLAHTRADRYPEPHAFRPERFVGSSPDTYAWVPFGGGVRRCLGAAFAEFEMRVVLREIVGRCVLRPADRRAESIARRNITFSPRFGTRVVVESKVAGGVDVLGAAEVAALDGAGVSK